MEIVQAKMELLTLLNKRLSVLEKILKLTVLLLIQGSMMLVSLILQTKNK